MSETIAEGLRAEPPPGLRRGRGRPPGARNKTSRTAKQLLDLHGKGAIETLCAVAAGHVVYGPPDEEGKRARLVPSMKERLQAATTIADKLLPSLKASEVVSDVTTRDEAQAQEHDPRHVARTVVEILSRAAVSESGEGASIAVVKPDEHAVTFSDPDLIRVRTGEGRERAKARGVRLGRKPKLTPHQRREALARRDAGELLVEIARSYAVAHSTLSRLP